jgi:predicted YcjX-like family ATPase
MSAITTIADEARIAFDNIGDLAERLISSGVRLGVTGLSRSGKTVFITALVHNLMHGGRMPVFEPLASGRMRSARLQPQPSMDVPRFQYEDHVRQLVDDRMWPDSTRAVAELRLSVEYESASFIGRTFGSGRLNIDLVDYPGEWLSDLSLLGIDYATWSGKALRTAEEPRRREHAKPFLQLAASIDPEDPADEETAQKLARHFTAYLAACRDDERILVAQPPGRFLLPGDLDGSPALTFCPLAELENNGPDSLYRLMADRFEAYKRHVAMPFFRKHFARLDRQVVLVDALQAINGGAEALVELRAALSNILASFRPGRGNILTAVFGPRIDRILFAATKADHLHHEMHDRLEAVLQHLVEEANDRAKLSGAEIRAMAIAAVRATREATVREDGSELPVIVGTPVAGEKIDGKTFDGKTRTAIFSGDLPADPRRLFSTEAKPVALRFVRFRPPELETTSSGLRLSLPHIRLDRALQFLLADKLA